MSAHIIGRPDDDVLDVLLGPGADPEQAFIADRKRVLAEGDGEDHRPGDDSTSRRAPTMPLTGRLRRVPPIEP